MPVTDSFLRSAVDNGRLTKNNQLFMGRWFTLYVGDVHVKLLESRVVRRLFLHTHDERIRPFVHSMMMMRGRLSTLVAVWRLRRRRLSIG